MLTAGWFVGVGCGRVIETHHLCDIPVGLDDSTTPYDPRSTANLTSNEDKLALPAVEVPS